MLYRKICIGIVGATGLTVTSDSKDDTDAATQQDIVEEDFDIFRKVFSHNLHATTLNACFEFVIKRDAEAFLCVSKHINRSCGTKTFMRWFRNNDGITSVPSRCFEMNPASSISFAELKRMISNREPIEEIDFQWGHAFQGGFTDIKIKDVRAFLVELKKISKHPSSVDEVLSNLPAVPTISDASNECLSKMDVYKLFFHVFKNYVRLQSVTIKQSFDLTHLEFPDGLEDLKLEITNGSLKVVKFRTPKFLKKMSFETVGPWNFGAPRHALETLELNDGLQDLKIRYFFNIKALTVPKTVKYLELGSLENVVELDLPDGLQELSLYNLPMKTLELPQGLQKLSLKMLTGLEVLDVPKAVTHLEVFQVEKIQSLDLHEGLQEAAFAFLYNLVELTHAGKQIQGNWISSGMELVDGVVQQSHILRYIEEVN